MYHAFLLLFLAISATTIFAVKGAWYFPFKLFLFFNAVMGIGILVQLDLREEADYVHGVVIVLTSFLLLVAGIGFSRATQNARAAIWRWRGIDLNRLPTRDVNVALVFYGVSLAATALYFYIVGYNVFLSAIFDSISPEEVTTMRLATYSTESYYAPGYFNQFKNIIFPCAAAAIVTYIAHRVKSLIMRVVALCFILIPLLVGLLGTGQRAFLISAVIFALIFMSLTNPNIFWRHKLLMAALLFFSIALFSISSFLQGRVGDFSATTSFTGLFSRFFLENQFSAVVGFRYIYPQNIQWGAEWLIDIVGALPYVAGSDLANRIFEVLYGTTRGTAPVSLWGSVYHNFGFAGIVVVPILLPFVYGSLTTRLLSRRRVGVLEAAAVSYVFFVLGSWVASGPMQLINNGLLTALLLLYVVDFLKRVRFS